MWVRRLGVLVLLSITSSAEAQSAVTPPPLDDSQLLHKYVWSTLGASGALHATFTAAFEDWRGSPPSWERESIGYVERWASEYAASAIGSTVKYGVARTLHQDPSFVRCDCVGVVPRVGHALTAPFKARTADGQWVFSPATIAGLTAQNVIPAATWYPAPRGIRDGAAHVVTGVVSKMAVDALHEFVPKIFKPKLF